MWKRSENEGKTHQLWVTWKVCLWNEIILHWMMQPVDEKERNCSSLTTRKPDNPAGEARRNWERRANWISLCRSDDDHDSKQKQREHLN